MLLRGRRGFGVLQTVGRRRDAVWLRYAPGIVVARRVLVLIDTSRSRRHRRGRGRGVLSARQAPPVSGSAAAADTAVVITVHSRGTARGPGLALESSPADDTSTASSCPGGTSASAASRGHAVVGGGIVHI